MGTIEIKTRYDIFTTVYCDVMEPLLRRVRMLNVDSGAQIVYST